MVTLTNENSIKKVSNGAENMHHTTMRDMTKCPDVTKTMNESIQLTLSIHKT